MKTIDSKLVKFRLKNFRSFSDTGDIEIKPINFLVGANSSGKSSILKFFPLLKQSIEGRSFNGVFRWYSEDVDFKDFNNTVMQNETEIEVYLNFNDSNISFCIVQDTDIFDKFKSISFSKDGKSFEIGEQVLKLSSKQNFFPVGRMVNWISKRLDYIDMQVSIFAENISYIKPIRVNIERYNRMRNDNVVDIVPDGSNLPMFLFNLSPEQLKAYNDFLGDNFGFGIHLRVSDGNIEILISEQDSISRNAVDMGYGYTEILPIVTTIWNKISVRKNLIIPRYALHQVNSLIVIEQPEVHLHPKFQSKFARMLCKVIKNYPNVRFFIETHSEAILNTIGCEIAYNRLNADDINVLRIEKNNSISTVKATGFDNDGYLKDWPIDFLDDDAY